MTGLINAAREARERGTFQFVESALLTPELNQYFPK